MTALQIVLAVVGAVLILAVAGALGYTVFCLLTGRRTVSGYLKNAPRLVVFIIGLVTGFVTGLMSGHWWFPTVGD